MSFKENLKEAMYCKNLTTVQLAALTNINSGTISSYLKTKNSMPPVDKALKLAKALDVSVDFLVNGFDSKKLISEQDMRYRGQKGLNKALMFVLYCLKRNENEIKFHL